MGTYEKRLQQLFHEFQEHIGGPGSLNEAVEWGLATGRIAEPQVDKKAILRADLARALQREKRTDSEGREYRANQSITLTLREGDMDTPMSKPKLAETLPPPQKVDERAIERMKAESREARAAMDQLVRNVQALSPADFKIRL